MQSGSVNGKTCASLIGQAGAAGTGTVTASPSGTGAGAAATGKSSKAAASTNTVPGSDIGILPMTLVVALAGVSGMAVVLL